MATATTTNTCADNCSNSALLYEFATDEIWTRWNEIAYYFEYQPWIFSIIGSTMVGLSGILPLFVIPIEEGANLKNGAAAGTLKILLSFAVGGLLGDVFLHLLPEAWASKALNIAQVNGARSMACGLWVLTGFLVFIIAEKVFIGEGEGVEDEEEKDESNLTARTKEKNNEYLNNNIQKEWDNNNIVTTNGAVGSKNHAKLKSSKNVEMNGQTMIDKSRLNETKNGYSVSSVLRKNDLTQRSSRLKSSSEFSCIPNRSNGFAKLTNPSFENEKKNDRQDDKTGSDVNVKPKGKHITGYLNLMANCIDNFTHGLAVGGSFLVSFRLGALTTFAILIHEIPHEVGDFAILLKSGFSRWDAARAQLLTASGGIFGALVAVGCSGSGIESRTSWILPFTAGGFLHIGMVTVLPELLKETNPKESMKQLGALLSGITVMAILTILCD
ncbi:zinc transporter ZIP13 homolog [Venturia canescens]|uniref:zinc transporter ZIP13 homolog n=1 Tax=Venturia canescens TaxID=32260 RepID=UPI001C9CFAFE|nr:zinc transporter ZIP13 homolog [Venturia canescens]